MKPLFIILAIILSLSVSAQKSKPIPDGEVYHLDSNGRHKDTTVNKNTVAYLTKNSTLTTNTAIYKDTVYPVYASKLGNLFYIRISKSGNYYRVYIDRAKSLSH